MAARYSRSDNGSHRFADASHDDALERYSRKRYGDIAGSSHARQNTSSKRRWRGRETQRGAHAATPDFDTYAAGTPMQYSRANPNYSLKSRKRMGRGKRIALGVACVLVLALIGCGTAFALFIDSVNSSLKEGVSESEWELINDALESVDYDEPFYILLVGSDERENSDESSARTDTNIVVRVDVPNSTVTLISIPRDTAIEIEGYGTQKFNAAYTFGGVSGVIEAANELLGIEISHFAMVDFEKLVQLIDAIGGVDVEVLERIDDSDAGNIVIEEGLQHLDGEAALVFARSRAYVDGDFTRTANQRILIQAIIEQVLSLSVTELPSVITAAANSVTTDMTATEILSLAVQLQDMGDLTIYSCMVPSTTGYIGNISYVFTDEEGLAEIMEVIEAGGDPSTVSTYGATNSTLESYNTSSSDLDDEDESDESGLDTSYGSPPG